MKKIIISLLFPCLLWSQAPILEATKLIEAKSYQQAELKLKAYLLENPNNREALELYGDALGYQKKWDDAIQTYKSLVSAQSENANYQYKYGGALAMKALSVNKLRAAVIIVDAKNAFLKAADLDPNHIDVRWALVELYMQLPGILGGSKNKSLAYADELDALSKVDGCLAKGYIYEYDDEPVLAEKYYKMAVNIGGSLTCYDKLSNFYQKQNQPENAIATIQTSIDKHQRNALHYQMGKVCAEYNLKLDQGAECLKTYINNYTTKDGVPVAWANYRLAQIFKHKGEKVVALNYIELALQELPNIEPFKDEKRLIEQL